ncbi:MAG: formylglycine-generating enzyme family protein [Gallionella sp.]|nr:formylglycine-generating enzyme family protein [Gallionella sp.]
MKPAWLGLVGCLWCCVAGASLDSKYQKQQEAEARERAAQTTPKPKPVYAPKPTKPRAAEPVIASHIDSTPITERTEKFGITMLSLPAGNFMMGCAHGRDGSCESDETPPHKVQLRGFELGKNEVTQAQWQAVMGSNPSHFKDCGDTCPVEKVSWDDVQTFIQKLNAQTGKTYRLPSEAEWEYAARAGSNSMYPWGQEASHEYANYGVDAGWGGLAQGRDKWVNSAPVGSFPANGFGLHDMIGNVWEWVQDSYHSDYNGAPTDGSVWSGATERRVLRGGSWFSIPQIVRAANRFNSTATDRSDVIGFRLARTLP